MFSSGMVRRLAIPFLLMAAVPAAPADAAAPPASVKLADCSVEESSAAFYGRMRPVAGSERMWMRFTVLEKQAGGYEPLRVRGLSRWHRSNPGVGAFGYRQTVRGLQPGGVYRAEVSFRWYSAGGDLIERTRRISAACRQFDAVPNLESMVAGAEATKVPGVLRYLVRVSNTGVAPAEDVEVQLSVDGGAIDTATVASLEPGESREVAILGPGCTSSVASLADPDGVIVESSEDDNGHTLPCVGMPPP
jgi:CARDB